MAKKRKEQPQETEVSKNPLRHLRPRLVPIRLSPFKQQFRNVADGTSFLANLKRTIDDEGHACPACEGQMTFQPREERGDDSAALVCLSCGHTDILALDPATALANAHRLNDHSNHLFYIGLGLAVLASLLAVYNRSLFTFAGGIILGGFLWLQAAGFRYRAWQHENMRLYEKKPPIKDWIKAEIPLLVRFSA